MTASKIPTSPSPRYVPRPLLASISKLALTTPPERSPRRRLGTRRPRNPPLRQPPRHRQNRGRNLLTRNIHLRRIHRKPLRAPRHRHAPRLPPLRRMARLPLFRALVLLPESESPRKLSGSGNDGAGYRDLESRYTRSDVSRFCAREAG